MTTFMYGSDFNVFKAKFFLNKNSGPHPEFHPTPGPRPDTFSWNSAPVAAKKVGSALGTDRLKQIFLH